MKELGSLAQGDEVITGLECVCEGSVDGEDRIADGNQHSFSEGVEWFGARHPLNLPIGARRSTS